MYKIYTGNCQQFVYSCPGMNLDEVIKRALEIVGHPFLSVKELKDIPITRDDIYKVLKVGNTQCLGRMVTYKLRASIKPVFSARRTWYSRPLFSIMEHQDKKKYQGENELP